MQYIKGHCAYLIRAGVMPFVIYSKNNRKIYGLIVVKMQSVFLKSDDGCFVLKKVQSEKPVF